MDKKKKNNDSRAITDHTKYTLDFGVVISHFIVGYNSSESHNFLLVFPNMHVSLP
jgi:hypothetical protein